jgi:hypothetical protein
MPFKTGMNDDNLTPIFVGDRLHSKDGYDVIVVTDGTGFWGKLVCAPSHSCANIPYALNNGVGYSVVMDTADATQ